MASSQTNFQNAHHFEVNNSQFINVENVTIDNNPATSGDPVSITLCEHVAPGAMFDSAERYPPGKCHPGTRETIIGQMKEWIADPDPIQCILWLYGPAGAGKSALAQSICEYLDHSDSDRYGASFFFSRGSTDRGNALKLITTLCYQLAIRFPDVRSEINKALNKDPMLPNKSVEIQMLSLIVEPILQCKGFPSHRPVIIIDGLDECADDEGASTQRNIISLIAKSVVDYNLPLRFMVFSRPEYWIRDTFDIPPLPQTTLHLSLRQTHEADMDIRAYLTDGFERIRMENQRVMGSVVLPWPSTSVIERLVYEASGQFIYASTVLRFVGKFSRFSNPKTQLNIITSPGSPRTSAFSELDRLYTAILSAYPRWETMKRVLGGLLVYPYPAIFRVLLDVDPDELVLVLDALSSLVDVTKPDISKGELILASAFQADPESLIADKRQIKICHESLREFLEDKARSGAFHVDAFEYQIEIVRAFFGVIHRNIDQGYQTEPHLLLNIDRHTYNLAMENTSSRFIRPTSSRCHIPLQLIEQMAKKLALHDEFYTSKSVNSLVHFAQDIQLLGGSIEKITLQPDFLDKKTNQTPWQRLDRAVLVAQKRAIHALTLLRDFTITPLLPSLIQSLDAGPDNDYEFLPYQDQATLSLSTSWGQDVGGITLSFSYMNCGDRKNTTNYSPFPFSDFTCFYPTKSEFLGMIKQNRHLLTLTYSAWEKREKEWFIALPNFKILLENWDAVDLRFKNEVAKEQTWLTCRLLYSAVFDLPNGVRMFTGNDFVSAGDPWSELKNIFNSERVANIRSKDDLQDDTAVSALLEFICDLPYRILNLLQPESNKSCYYAYQLAYALPGFVISLICWLNKQVTTLQVLGPGQEFLLQRLTVTMNNLFEKFFLPTVIEASNKKGFYAHNPSRYQPVILILQPASLPRGFRTLREVHSVWGSSISDDWKSPDSPRLYWRRFHKNIFGDMDGTTERSIPPVIAPSCWHPYLASILLKDLVKFLYSQVYPEINKIFISEFKESLSYITQCLPFALPTPENLDALRLVVYLYPQAAVSPVLPEGIWVLISGFLKKYDRSVLSSEELDLFESWLHSEDHGDIKKYVKS